MSKYGRRRNSQVHSCELSAHLLIERAKQGASARLTSAKPLDGGVV